MLVCLETFYLLLFLISVVVAVLEDVFSCVCVFCFFINILIITCFGTAGGYI